jgi:transposase-like protein
MSCIRMRGKKSTLHPDPADPPRRRANKRRGRGTYANDRPPIVSIISRTTGEHRYWVAQTTTKEELHELVRENVPDGSTVFFYTDELASYAGAHPQHGTVCHSAHEWARDDDGDGRREVHCNTCEGRGTALRTYLRPFRGVHKRHLWHYVATYEAMSNARQISPALIHRMSVGYTSAS